MEEDDPKVNADFTVNDGKLYYKRKNGQEQGCRRPARGLA